MNIRFLNITGVTVAIVMLVVVMNPEYRAHARALFVSSSRTILSVAKADLDGTGEEYQILKVKNPEGLFVEVYSQQKIGDMLFPKLVASVKMPDKRDGYFTYNGLVTNLAIDSIDNNPRKQILVTSYDENMVARLNVYQFDKSTSTLKTVSIPE